MVGDFNWFFLGTNRTSGPKKKKISKTTGDLNNNKHNLIDI